jgi:hypothetical protein
MRGEFPGYKIILENEQLNTKMWSPVLYAVANPNKLVDAVKFMVQELGMHTALCLKEPLYESEKDGTHS